MKYEINCEECGIELGTLDEEGDVGEVQALCQDCLEKGHHLMSFSSN